MLPPGVHHGAVRARRRTARRRPRAGGHVRLRCRQLRRGEVPDRRDRLCRSLHRHATDLAHCGSCGNACASGAACDAGACQCPAGQVACGQACVDLASSEANCGQCGHACGLGTCEAGACVCDRPPVASCGASASPECVDLGLDAASCGSRGHACAGERPARSAGGPAILAPAPDSCGTSCSAARATGYNAAPAATPARSPTTSAPPAPLRERQRPRSARTREKWRRARRRGAAARRSIAGERSGRRPVRRRSAGHLQRARPRTDAEVQHPRPGHQGRHGPGVVAPGVRCR